MSASFHCGYGRCSDCPGTRHAEYLDRVTNVRSVERVPCTCPCHEEVAAA